MNTCRKPVTYGCSLLGALGLAAEYRRRLACACERIELTGQLRRRRFNWQAPEETCLELLAVPRTEVVSPDQPGLGEYRRDHLREAVLELVDSKEFTAPEEEGLWRTRGRYRLVNEVCELVIWVAEARSFGSHWLWRTGSRRHNEWLCDRARRRGLCWVVGSGLCTGLRTCGAEEEAIYHGLGLRFVPPELREAGRYEESQFDLAGEEEP